MISMLSNNKISFFVISFCLALIIFISGLVIVYDKLMIDDLVYSFLVGNFACSFMDKFMIGITRLGDTKFVMFFTSIMFLIFLVGLKQKNVSFVFIFSVISVAFTNQVFKFIVKRIRPNVNKLIEIGGYSFPSGHAMVSTILYGLVAYFAYKFIKNKYLRNIVVLINILLILLICISRIYLGVHYFSDILVGFLISLVFLFFIVKVVEKNIFSQN